MITRSPRWLPGRLMLPVLIFLTACTQTTATEPPPVVQEDFAATVSVTGKLVPAVWTAVGATIGGRVTEVVVSEGDIVAGGDILLQLDDRDAQVAVRRAEAGVRQAEAGVAQAEAALAQLTAGPREEDIAVALAQVAAARAALTQTVEQRDQLWAGRLDANLAAADAEIAAAQAQELTARQVHDELLKCYTVELPDGTKDEVCPTLGTYEERARFQWHAARQALAAAEEGKSVLEPQHWAQLAIAEAGIDAAAEQVTLAEQQAAQVQAPTRPVDLAAAEAAVLQAEAAVTQAEAALEAAALALAHTVVAAPLGGTVGTVDIRIGQYAAPGIPLITLGDLTTLRVETTDLDEIDVGRVVVGQSAVVTFDAVPDRTFDATVTRIAPIAAAGGGGVNYTVVLELAELDPILRWGMTAFVDIETE